MEPVKTLDDPKILWVPGQAVGDELHPSLVAVQSTIKRMSLQDQTTSTETYYRVRGTTVPVFRLSHPSRLEDLRRILVGIPLDRVDSQGLLYQGELGVVDDVIIKTSPYSRYDQIYAEENRTASVPAKANAPWYGKFNKRRKQCE